MERAVTSRAAVPQDSDAGVDVLRAALRSAAAGRGSVVLIRGPAGIGKSRLLNAAAALARPVLTLLVARGTELERELPFGAVLQLLEERVRRPADVLAGPAGMAKPLFLDVGAGASNDSSDQQLTLIHGLYRLVADLAARGPLALLVDDAHEVDQPSLRFLAYLARRVRDLPVALVIALRPSHPGADAHLLGELVQTPGALRVEPGPLSEETVVRLVTEALGRRLDPAFARACVRVTGGNPLLVRELARGLAQQGTAGVAAEVELVNRIGPEPVAWAVEATLRRLPGPASKVATAVSVFETHGTVELAAALAGVDAGAARKVIREMQVAQLLEGDIELRFAHPLIGQAVLASVPPAERALLHGGAAELLAERGDHLTAAGHLLLSPPAARPWAVQALLASADHARRGASPERAIELLERALKEPPNADQRPRVLAELARAQAATGDIASVETFSAALAVTHEDRDRARLLVGLALAYQDQARFPEAAEAAARGLAIDVRDEQLRAELAAIYDTAVLWSSGGAGEDMGPGTHAQTPREDLVGEVSERLFAGRDHSATADIAHRAWGGGAELAGTAAEDPNALRLFTVLHNADAQREALQIADRCLAEARRSGSRLDTATWQHMRGHVLAYMGRLDDAEIELRAAFAAHEHGWSAWLPVNASALVYLLIERDDLDGADTVLSVVDASTVHPRESAMWAITDAARGRLALVRGDAVHALAILEAAGRSVQEKLGMINPALSPWRSDTVLALAELGRTVDAVALAEEDLALAESWGAPRALGGALRVRALVADPGERLRWLTRAVDVLEPSETRLDYAHAVYALGRAQREAGDEAARDTLRVALDLAEQCGGRRLARRVLAELHAAGSRPRRHRLEGPASLTESEARVARLASSGLSTREIAEQLVVTPRAVAFHLGNVYRKLGISGRGELTAALKPPGD